MVSNTPNTSNTFDGIDPAAINAGPGMRVALYLRKSPTTKGQAEISIDRQRNECRAYAARNGWHIVGEYIDAGKSGSRDIAKRVDFHRMVADAAKGEFTAVLVWDSARFGRLDPLDGADAKVKLRKAGVHLECVNGGRIDWATQMGRMQDFMHTEQNHEYARGIGKNSVSGRNDALAGGYWPHGAIPFGFDRQYYQSGQPIGPIVPRHQQTVRGRGWRLKLVPNAAEGELIRWIYDQYVNHGMSRRKIGEALTRRGVITPRGGRAGWTNATVLDVLLNPANRGATTSGFGRRRLKEVFHRTNNTVMEGTHPEVVDAKLWAAAQVKIAKDREPGDKQRAARTGGSNQKSPLSGVIVCGHCGYRCDCKSRTYISTGKRYRYFTCSSATKRPQIGCKQWTATEEELLKVVRRELVDAIDGEALRRMQAKPPEHTTAELDSMKAKAALLAKDVARGEVNLLRADPENFDGLQTMLSGMKAELRATQNTITIAEGAEDKSEFIRVMEWWDAQRKANGLVVVKNGEVGEWKYHTWIEDDEVKEGWIAPLTAEPVEVEADTFRTLLSRLNCTLNIFWSKGKGERYHSLDTGKIRVELDPHALGAISNKCTRARTPGRG